MTMQPLEFRFYFFTPLYAETVAFYRDVLRFEIFRTWDRPDDRGTIFESPNGRGLIEVEEGTALPNFTGGLYIQVEDVDARFAQVRNAGAPILKELGVTSYGHRNFKTKDPSGVEIAFFQYA